MPVTSTELEAVRAGAAATTRFLPASGLQPGSTIEGAASIEQALPSVGSKAVSASLAGASYGSIVLIVSPSMAEQIENGPLGAQDLVAGLDVALTDATAALAEQLGELRHEAPMGLPADVAISNVASYDSVIAVPLVSDGVHLASLVVLLSSQPVSMPTPPAAGGGQSAQFDTFNSVGAAMGASRSVELLSDVEMGVTAELGRTRMTVRELLSLQPGSVVELDRAAGSPVDLLVNGTLVARGEVVVIDEEFGVRITEIVGYEPKK